MTAAIHSIADARIEREPHMHGRAVCLACKHEWQAVAPVGVFELECPECHIEKGVLKYTVMRGEEFFQCNCGCNVFRIARQTGPYCINCAELAVGWF